MSTEHTQGEWRIGDAGLTIFGPRINEPTPKTIAVASHSNRTTLAERKANIRRIVHAVNNHDALVAALEAALPAVEYYDLHEGATETLRQVAVALKKGQR